MKLSYDPSFDICHYFRLPVLRTETRWGVSPFFPVFNELLLPTTVMNGLYLGCLYYIRSIRFDNTPFTNSTRIFPVMRTVKSINGVVNLRERLGSFLYFILVTCPWFSYQKLERKNNLG